MILAAKAPASVWEVGRSDAGVLRNLVKEGAFVNYYSLHIMDPAWGHVVIKIRSAWPGSQTPCRSARLEGAWARSATGCSGAGTGGSPG
jgi:hypothetical protein